MTYTKNFAPVTTSSFAMASTVAWENSWQLATLPDRFPRQMMSEKRVQKFHTDEVPLPR